MGKGPWQDNERPLGYGRLRGQVGFLGPGILNDYTIRFVFRHFARDTNATLVAKLLTYNALC